MADFPTYSHAETPVHLEHDADFYLQELDKANKKIDKLFHFIEMTEALTYDQATSKRIRSFLIEEGIWQAEK